MSQEKGGITQNLLEFQRNLPFRHLLFFPVLAVNAEGPRERAKQFAGSPDPMGHQIVPRYAEPPD